MNFQYKNKYLKYKSKYLNLIGGACKNSSIEIGQEPVLIEPDNNYIITGLITCVGLIIKKVNFDLSTGNCSIISGIGIHFIDGTFFKNPNFTEEGIKVLNQIKEMLDSWDIKDDIEIELIAKPDMLHNEHVDTIALKKALVSWFNDLKKWENVHVFNYSPLQINGHYNKYFKFST